MHLLDWNTALSAMRDALPQSQFNNWISPVEYLRCDDSTVFLGVPSRFHEDWVKNHYADELKQILQKQTGKAVQLSFEILLQKENEAAAESPSPSSAGLSVAHSRPTLRVVDGNPAPHKESQKDFYEDLEERRPCHSNIPSSSTPFLEGAFNRTAFQCAKLFGQGTDRQVSTLVFLAGVGMGKTYLLAETGNLILKQDPLCRVRYTHSESFTNEMVLSFKNNTVREFKKKYQEETDVLLFDDVHNLTNRLRTQEQLLHIFNEITARGGRVAFSSAVPPQRLSGFIEPLKSRLLSGMIGEVRPLTFDEKVNLLGQVSYQMQMAVDPEVLRTLADKGQRDIRELIGSFIRLHVQAQIQNRNLNTKFLAEEGMFAVPAQSISMEEIIALVEHNYGISREDLLSKSRKSSIAWARQVAMYLGRRFTELSLQAIGNTFGRDHATACYAFDKVRETMEEQPSRKYEVEFLVGKLECRKSPNSPGSE
jgi:chromosomal replication initiator protein